MLLIVIDYFLCFDWLTLVKMSFCSW